MHIKNDGLLVDDSLLLELGTENPDALLLIKKINQIDLEPIKKRFVIKKRWQESSADLAIKEYRQFLFDCYTSKEPKSPSKLVDEVWHDHILHTKKYAEDCQKTFGKFIHHTPNGEMCGAEGSSGGSCNGTPPGWDT